MGTSEQRAGLTVQKGLKRPRKVRARGKLTLWDTDRDGEAAIAAKNQVSYFMTATDESLQVPGFYLLDKTPPSRKGLRQAGPPLEGSVVQPKCLHLDQRHCAA